MSIPYYHSTSQGLDYFLDNTRGVYTLSAGGQVVLSYDSGRRNSAFSIINEVAGRVIALVNDDGVFHYFGTSGTSGSTQQILEYDGRGRNVYVSLVNTINNRDVLLINDGGVYHYYATNGTAGGTQQILEYDGRGRNVDVSLVNTVNNRDVLLINDGGVFHYYGTDGTAGGTQQILQYDGRGRNVYVSLVNTVNNRDVLSINDGGVFHYYGTDGTSAGTQELMQFDGRGRNVYVSLVNTINGRDVLLINDGGIYRYFGTNGTAAGTQDLFSYDARGTASNVSLVDSKAGFDLLKISAGSDVHYFATDGTKANTKELSRNIDLGSWWNSLIGTVAIGDVSISEGNSGVKTATFTVTRSGGAGAFSVNFATSNGTAQAGSDYAANSGTLSFGVNQNSATISVQIYGDAAYEGDETFAVNLSGATNGAVIARGRGTGTIVNDDAGAGALTVSDVSIAEGSGGTRYAVFTVSRAGGVIPFSVGYSTANGTAIAGSDYGAVSGTLSFAANQNTATISVPIYGDTTYEANETFFLNLSGATNGATLARNRGTGTITNDDAGAGDVSISDVSIVEGDGGTRYAVFTLTRTGGTPAFSLNYATANGTANAGSDYAATAGTLSFAANQNTATVSVPIYGDTAYEADETFFLNLSGATNGATITRAQAKGTITNDDAWPGSVTLTDVTIAEGDSGTRYAVFTIVRTGGTAAFSLDYATANDTARAGSDYGATSGKLSFAANQSSATISVPIYGDKVYEANETFFLNLSGASNGATIARAQARATITNDDAFRDDFAGNSSTTGRLALNAPVSGIVDYFGDHDWFGMQLTAGGKYTAQVQARDADFGRLTDPMLRVYDAHGALVASQHGSALSFTPSSSGTYYLDVGSYSDAGVGGYTASLSIIWGRKPV